jgi:hypothetical protein
MIIVKIDTLDRSNSDRILDSILITAKTVGGALNQHVTDPADGAKFLITIIGRSPDPVYA